ncbi:MAG: hypothetical protein H0X30_34720 [Anaerolineae bacterium]|nr:hypothetical protein [Anaerolineae bacterium]
MQPLEAAILRTVLYADVFNFPMTLEEIHHFLISDDPISLDEIAQTLSHSVWLKQKLQVIDDYVIYGGHVDLVQLRQKREAASQFLWPQALYWGRWLAALPFVRMVALTGALAVRNAADGDDDLDYMLVTSPHRVWLARAFAIAVVRIGRLRGVKICPNYVLAETSLVQTRRDIFLAHEVAQMVPIYGQDYYRRFREANDWVYQQLPNALDPFFDVDQTPTNTSSTIKQLLEVVCGGTVGNWIEQWEYQRKLRRFAADMQTPHSSAQVDDTQVKGHFNDHGHPALQKYDQRLRECGLIEEPLASTGD